MSTLNGFLVDAITNLAAVRHFVGWKKERHLLDTYQDDVIKKMRRVVLSYSIMWTVVGTSMALMQGFLLWKVVQDFRVGTVSAGDIAMIVTYAMAISRLFTDVLFALPDIAHAVGNLRESLTLIYKPIQITDAPDAVALRAHKGVIAFDNVSFAYPNGTKVFDGLTLHIAGGQKVGLVGYSGSGKTTLINILMRYYDGYSGTVTVDGQDIAHVTMDSLRAAMAHVPQDSMLFHRSLFDNIAYGRYDAARDDVMHAATQASAHEFIHTLHQGYDTKVGERGIKLSGGQRQRVAIARAILSKAPILLLDEATSALDSVTEREIQGALETAMQGRTAVVIAHRLATLKHLDRLIVLDQGRIVEDGTLDELLALNGHFAKLWHMQSGGFLPDHA